MTPSRRQRLVDAIWPDLEKVLNASTADRSLRTALTTATTSNGTGKVHLAASGSAPGLAPGDDLALEATTVVTTDRMLLTAVDPRAPIVADTAKLACDFFEIERAVLSSVVVASTSAIVSESLDFPRGIVSGIVNARRRLQNDGALDLMLSPGHADLLKTSDNADRTSHALRGGSVLVVSGEADGLVVPHLPGAVTFGEVEPLRLDWDCDDGANAIRLTLSERLRYWRTEPPSEAVNLILPP